MGSPAGTRPADAIVVGSGPERAGGGGDDGPGRARGARHRGRGHARRRLPDRELTLPGFRTMCARPCTRWPPPRRSSSGSTWPRAGSGCCTPKVAFAHPLDGGRAGAVAGSVDETAAAARARRPRLPAPARPAGPRAAATCPTLLAPLCAPSRRIRSPWPASACAGVLPASVLARRFRDRGGRALLAGVAAHAMLPLTAPLTSGFGLMLMMLAHAVGWPVVEGGSAGDHRRPGRRAGRRWAAGSRPAAGSARWTSLPPARAVLLDVTPRQFAAHRRRAGSRPGSAALRRSVRARRLQGRLGAPGRCPGRPRPAGRRAPCTWAARSPRWRAARPT